MHKSKNSCSQTELTDRLKSLRKLAPDKFSLLVLEGAQHAIADTDNPLRLNFFSVAMRILFEHMTTKLAWNDEVIQCSWFNKAEGNDGKSTRWQRVIFAIQGGFSDEFVTGKLGVDPQPLRKRLSSAIEDLNKQIHVNEDTIILDRSKQNRFAMRRVKAMKSFLEAVYDCRAAVLEPIKKELDDTAVEALLNDTIFAVDELATHHSIEEIYVEEIFVHRIGAKTITYRATGSVSVMLQWGSSSDFRKGDGAEMGMLFPFICNIELPLEYPWDIEKAAINYAVDTSEWYGIPHPSDHLLQEAVYGLPEWTGAMRPDEREEWY